MKYLRVLLPIAELVLFAWFVHRVNPEEILASLARIGWWAPGVFVPAALGVQESGFMLLFQVFGLPAGPGAAYAVLRRGREVCFVFVGGLLLYAEGVTIAALRRRMRAGTGENEDARIVRETS